MQLTMQNQQTAIKNMGDGRIGGYLVRFGDAQTRDLQGEYFTKQTDFALDWYKERPMLYHHGLGGELKTAVIGIIDHLKVDEVGIWAEAQLDMRSNYVKKVLELVKKGILHWSSGSIAHLVEITKNGEIKRWPLVEGSLTPTPAEPRQETQVHSMKHYLDEPLAIKAYSAVQLTYDKLQTKNDTLLNGDSSLENPPAQASEIREDNEPIEGASHIESDGAGASAPPEPTQAKEDSMNPEQIQQLVDEIVALLMDSLGHNQETPAAPPAMAAARSAALDLANNTVGIYNLDNEAAKLKWQGDITNIAAKTYNDKFQELDSQRLELTNTLVSDAIKGMQQQPTDPAQDLSRGGAAQTTPQIEVGQTFNKYNDLSAADMAFMMVYRNASAKDTLKFFGDDEFHRTFADKVTHDEGIVGKMWRGDKLIAESINDVMTGHFNPKAFKADLANTGAAGFGAEYVNQTWSGQLWETARMDNVILSSFERAGRVVNMPSNDFVLPTEGSDPDVYFVSETTGDTEDAGTAAIPNSRPGTGKVSLSSKKLALRSGYSEEENEDSIIRFAKYNRQKAERAIKDAIDNILVNGDTTAGTVNINKNGVAISQATPEGKVLALDGLMHLALGDGAVVALQNDAANAAPSLALFRTARFKLANALAMKPSELIHLVGVETFAKLLDLPEFLTMDKAGRLATALSGQLGLIDGVPIMVTDKIALGDGGGLIDAVTPANNTQGRAVTYAPSQYWVGFRRRIKLVASFVHQYDAWQLSATVRIDMQHLTGSNSATTTFDMAV